MLTSTVAALNGIQDKNQNTDTRSIDQKIQQLKEQIRNLKNNKNISPEEQERRIKNIEDQIKRLEEQKQKMENMKRRSDKESEKDEYSDKLDDGLLNFLV